MPSKYPAEVWATIQACTSAVFLTEHPEALTLRVQRIEREMADPRRRRAISRSKVTSLT